MPTPTYQPLATITLSSSAASVTFSSISQAYRDLVLVVAARTSDSTSNMILHFNGDSGNNYNMVEMLGDGSSASSNSNFSASQYTAARIGGSTNLGSTIIQIMDFATTDKHKSFLSRGNASELLTSAVAGRWASTSAITSVALKPYYGAASFAAGSTFSLYGISA